MKVTKRLELLLLVHLLVFSLYSYAQYTPCKAPCLMEIGEANQRDFIRVILPLDNGRIVVAGWKEEQSFVMLLDEEHKPFWQKSINFSGDVDFVSNMILDEDGMLVGAGTDLRNSNRPAFIFKMNPLNGELIWSKFITTPVEFEVDEILDLQSPDRYAFIGDHGLPEDVSGIGRYGYFITVDKNDGTIYSEDLSILDVNYKAAVKKGDEVFLSGYGFRQDYSIFQRLNAQGNIIQSLSYRTNPLDSTSLRIEDIVLSGNEIWAVALKQKLNQKTSSVLLKLDLDGNIIWSKEYQATIGNLYLREINQSEDGMILSGTYLNFETNERGSIVVQIDEEAQIIDNKTLPRVDAFNGFILELATRDSLLYMGGYVVVNGTVDNDIYQSFFAALPITGNLGDTNCQFFSTTEILENDINVFQSSFDVEVVPTTIPITNGQMSGSNIATPITYLCNELNTVNVSAINETLPIQIFPNPFTNFLNIQTGNREPANLQLVDILGRVIMEEKFESQLDLSTIEPGIFLLLLLDENANILHQETLIKSSF